MRVLFYLLSVWTIASGLLAISLRNIVHCAISLIAFFAGIAAIFFSLRAEFLGAVQIIVYVGAVAVLILFAIMLTRHVAGDRHESPFTPGAIWGVLTSLAVLGALIYSLAGQPIQTPTNASASLSVGEIGRVLMTRYAVPFEVISLLLTAALIGAVVIALEEPKKEK